MTDKKAAFIAFGMVIALVVTHIGMYYFGKARGANGVWQIVANAPAKVDTVWKFVSVPIPGTAPPPVVIPGQDVIVADSAALAKKDAEIAQWKTKHGSVEAALNAMADEFRGRDSTIVLTAPDSLITLGMDLTVTASPLYRTFTYTLGPRFLTVKQGYVFKDTYLVRDTREPWWVKAGAAGMAVATYYFVDHKQYGWAAGAGAASLALISFKWEF